MQQQERAARPIAAHEIALGFIAGMLGGAQSLAHATYLRAGTMLSRLLAITQIASQPTPTRFFSLFWRTGINQRVFTLLYNWAIASAQPARRLQSGSR
jgi:hypothetical protein